MDEYIIRVSENALIQMCLNGLEAYCVPHLIKIKSHARVETGGLLWGHEISLKDGGRKKTLYCIEMASIETSVSRTSGSVELDDASLVLKRDILTSFWPQYDFLGDFHTHPYKKSAQEVIKEKLYHFTDSSDGNDNDCESIESKPKFYIKHHYRVGLVLTITTLKKKTMKAHQLLDNLSAIEFTLGNYRLWIKGYVAITTNEGKGISILDHRDANIFLQCPSIVGLIDEYTSFGKGVTGHNQKHKPGSI